MPFIGSETPVIPGDVFQPEIPESAELSFITSLPRGIFFGGDFYPFGWHVFYKKYMQVQADRMMRE
jgi:hypothetical protein